MISFDYFPFDSQWVVSMWPAAMLAVALGGACNGCRCSLSALGGSGGNHSAGGSGGGGFSFLRACLEKQNSKVPPDAARFLVDPGGAFYHPSCAQCMRNARIATQRAQSYSSHANAHSSSQHASAYHAHSAPLVPDASQAGVYVDMNAVIVESTSDQTIDSHLTDTEPRMHHKDIEKPVEDSFYKENLDFYKNDSKENFDIIRNLQRNFQHTHSSPSLAGRPAASRPRGIQRQITVDGSLTAKIQQQIQSMRQQLMSPDAEDRHKSIAHNYSSYPGFQRSVPDYRYLEETKHREESEFQKSLYEVNRKVTELLNCKANLYALLDEAYAQRSRSRNKEVRSRSRSLSRGRKQKKQETYFDEGAVEERDSSRKYVDDDERYNQAFSDDSFVYEKHSDRHRGGREGYEVHRDDTDRDIDESSLPSHRKSREDISEKQEFGRRSRSRSRHRKQEIDNFEENREIDVDEIADDDFTHPRPRAKSEERRYRDNRDKELAMHDRRERSRSRGRPRDTSRTSDNYGMSRSKSQDRRYEVRSKSHERLRESRSKSSDRLNDGHERRGRERERSYDNVYERGSQHDNQYGSVERRRRRDHSPDGESYDSNRPSGQSNLKSKQNMDSLPRKVHERRDPHVGGQKSYGSLDRNERRRDVSQEDDYMYERDDRSHSRGRTPQSKQGTHNKDDTEGSKRRDRDESSTDRARQSSRPGSSTQQRTKYDENRLRDKEGQGGGDEYHTRGNGEDMQYVDDRDVKSRRILEKKGKRGGARLVRSQSCAETDRLPYERDNDSRYSSKTDDQIHSASRGKRSNPRYGDPSGRHNVGAESPKKVTISDAPDRIHGRNNTIEDDSITASDKNGSRKKHLDAINSYQRHGSPGEVRRYESSPQLRGKRGELPNSSRSRTRSVSHKEAEYTRERGDGESGSGSRSHISSDRQGYGDVDRKGILKHNADYGGATKDDEDSLYDPDDEDSLPSRTTGKGLHVETSKQKKKAPRSPSVTRRTNKSNAQGRKATSRSKSRHVVPPPAEGDSPGACYMENEERTPDDREFDTLVWW